MQDGLELLGEADAAWLSADALHPTPEGYENMGQRYASTQATRTASDLWDNLAFPINY